MAYGILHIMEPSIVRCDDPVKAAQAIKTLKADIRAYHHRAENTHRLVKDYGVDGYVELFTMPEVTDPEAWFDENERLVCKPSPYDCTGQAFTEWHKIFRRNGQLMCYHGVGYDV